MQRCMIKGKVNYLLSKLTEGVGKNRSKYEKMLIGEIVANIFKANHYLNDCAHDKNKKQ